MKDEAGTLPSSGIEEEGHVCINALLELAAQFSHPRSAYDYSPTLHSVTARLQDALDIAISGNQLPASRCPLCPIALELIQIQNEANDLARNENRWCSILRYMLTFALHGLRSAKQTRMENRLKNIDYRLGEVSRSNWIETRTQRLASSKS
ncbi:hypothetical protein F5887DRAFT_61907 [Amanita rubescens]|nr:hypothetical protein F5887DRAFT_61907 [Amanita rubescens]